MESMQMIKSRIQSIGSTRQITQSMRMVSTAKVQKSRNRMAGNRAFSEQIQRFVGELPRSFGDSRHPYLKGNQSDAAAVIVISGDRGLCGGYNLNVCKEAVALADRISGKVRMVTVGVKAKDYFGRRRRKAARSFTGVSETPFFDDAVEIGSIALDWFQRGEVGAVYLVYTRFQTLLSQTPLHSKLLPLEPDAGTESTGIAMRFEPESDAFLERVVPLYVNAVIYGALLESSACEQSARITSMDAAVKNSDEMIASLTLLYNQARQGAITREITEIVGGAEALAQRKD